MLCFPGHSSNLDLLTQKTMLGKQSNEVWRLWMKWKASYWAKTIFAFQFVFFSKKSNHFMKFASSGWNGTQNLMYLMSYSDWPTDQLTDQPSEWFEYTYENFVLQDTSIYNVWLETEVTTDHFTKKKES